MIDAALSWFLRRWHARPCFQIYGKAIPESEWRLIDVYVSPRHNFGSGWPLVQGTCVTWTSRAILIGEDTAEQILREQCESPCSRELPVQVKGGRLRNGKQRIWPPSACEILAHECGHTFQALRLDPVYLPLVGSVTLFGEGDYLWNYFENEASAVGQFGGILSGSVEPEFWKRVGKPG